MGWIGSFVVALRVSAGGSSRQSHSATESLALVGVSVVDVESGQVLPDQTVLIVGSEIRAVASDGRVDLPTEATDAWAMYDFPGSDLHSELWHMVEAGLTPLEALRTATLTPAQYMHVADSLGSIRPGKLADLVLLDGNPLADIRNTEHISGVVANGRYLDRPALDLLLAEARHAASTSSP
ncbi:MAG TPA: amidohydrolase family protein [Gemmatimonadota bacterium]|nr:amidohydrolase family protein [Gemmatimonadota bacterium]